MTYDQKTTSIKSFTDLKAWQMGHQLVIQIYKNTKTFPKDEMHGLTNQIRRAAVSITSNIAEGFGRQTYKDKVNFFYQAHGSLTEVKNQLLIARDVGYLSVSQFNETAEIANQTHMFLQGLITKSKSFIKQK